MPFAGLSLGVQLDQFAGNVLDLFLGASFEIFPGFRTQFAQFWRCSFPSNKFGNFMQGVEVQVAVEDLLVQAQKRLRSEEYLVW